MDVPRPRYEAAGATEFLEDDGGIQDQEMMARLTGNYRRGNERETRDHRRNRHS